METQLTNHAEYGASDGTTQSNWFVTYTDRGKLHVFEGTRRIIIDSMPTDSLASLISWMSIPRRKAKIAYKIVSNEDTYAVAELIQLNLEH